MRKNFKKVIMTCLLLMIVSLTPAIVAQAETEEKGSLFEVDTAYLNMRTEPGIDAEIIGQLVKGDKLRIFDEEEGWVKTFYDGQPVWVASEHLLEIEETPIDESNLKQEDKLAEKLEPEEKIDESIEQKENDTTEEANEEDFSFDTFSLQHATDEKINLPTGRLMPNKVKISKNTIVVTKNQLEGYQILIDAGHGGKDSGATSKGVYEKDLTLSTAQKVAESLEQEGATVELTRENDTFITLANRVYQSNTEDTDVFISLHYDYFEDPEVNGMNTYFFNSQTSEELANDVHTALTEAVDMQDRGVREANYYVLENNSKPALLLELGFMTNPENLETIQTEDYQKDVAQAITDGLTEYFDEE